MKTLLTILLTISTLYISSAVIAKKYIYSRLEISFNAYDNGNPANYVDYEGVSYYNVESVEMAILQNLFFKIYPDKWL